MPHPKEPSVKSDPATHRPMQFTIRTALLAMLAVALAFGWYFNTPPLYDEKTLFPNGFAPAAQGWTRAK